MANEKFTPFYLAFGSQVEASIFDHDDFNLFMVSGK